MILPCTLFAQNSSPSKPKACSLEFTISFTKHCISFCNSLPLLLVLYRARNALECEEWLPLITIHSLFTYPPFPHIFICKDKTFLTIKLKHCATTHSTKNLNITSSVLFGLSIPYIYRRFKTCNSFCSNSFILWSKEHHIEHKQDCSKRGYEDHSWS